MSVAVRAVFTMFDTLCDPTVKSRNGWWGDCICWMPQQAFSQSITSLTRMKASFGWSLCILDLVQRTVLVVECW